MVESPIHLKLKEITIQKLLEDGYEEVQEEKTIFIENKKYRVDLVASKNGKHIAIECGKTNNSKIKALSTSFDKVSVIRPIEAIEFLEGKLTRNKEILHKYERRVGELESKNVIDPEDLPNMEWIWIKVPSKYLHAIRKMLGVFIQKKS